MTGITVLVEVVTISTIKSFGIIEAGISSNGMKM